MLRFEKTNFKFNTVMEFTQEQMSEIVSTTVTTTIMYYNYSCQYSLNIVVCICVGYYE